MPSDFRKARIFLLLKKGEVNDVHNDRGISFIDFIAKIFSRMLIRLQLRTDDNNFTYGTISWVQENSTTDQIFNLAI